MFQPQASLHHSDIIAVSGQAKSHLHKSHLHKPHLQLMILITCETLLTGGWQDEASGYYFSG